MNLYPVAAIPFDAGLFKNPTAEYRAAPFWSWNNTLNRAQLLRQIGTLKEMGMGGFHMHPRTGLGTPYLGPEFMECVQACVAKAREEKMLAWLYDEDRWPSGFGGGLVTRDEAFRARHLLWTVRPPAEVEGGALLAAYEVVLKNGCLQSYRRLAENGARAGTTGRIWYAYEQLSTLSEWFGGYTYVDTLNPAAIRRFVELTHERYLETVGTEFGKTVPAIFTDEPQFVCKQSLSNAEALEDLKLPYTGDLFQSYARAYGDRLEDRLPEVFWDLPEGRASLARYRYNDHVCERFTAAFADTIGDWCTRHGIALTGHMMEEPTLKSQTAALGEAMRSYRAFHLPGIDMLCDGYEFNTAKQAQSAAHQFGRPGVLSELYGVTGWHYDFAGHKGHGDWQAALGVTVRVPHLTWVSMEGEAKRDYPASIGYQSPWYREYPLIENHFARVNVALTRGKPLVRVGVIHPIESYWLCSGPMEETRTAREGLEARFAELTQCLLFGLVDFDFICESLLPAQNTGAGADVTDGFMVGEMNYRVVLVPGLATIRSTTLDRLEAFAESGGVVLFLGDVPHLVDVVPSRRAHDLAGRCATIEFGRAALLLALEPWREIAGCEPERNTFQEIAYPRVTPDDCLVHQFRADGHDRYLFICNTDREFAREAVPLRLRGHWDLTELDTMTGEAHPLTAKRCGGWTQITWDFPAHGHLLLQMRRATDESADTVVSPTPVRLEIGRLKSPVPVTLSEPNVLLLDTAAYRFDDGEWQPPQELLRLENAARAHFGMSAMHGEVLQPWIHPDPGPTLGYIELRFTWRAEVPVAASHLAIETVASAQIWLDGAEIPAMADGWWVDEAIHTVPLPPMEAGEHELRIRLPFNRRTHLEWCYLLGHFGVTVRGAAAWLTAPVRELAWGDWTVQGLPFYAGNVTYHARLPDCPGGASLLAPHFEAPLLTVAIDGQRIGPIAFAPFRLELPDGTSAKAVDITAFGNRANAFGPVHNADTALRWFGPGAWRTEGAAWSDEYQLRPMGIMTAPIMET